MQFASGRRYLEEVAITRLESCSHNSSLAYGWRVVERFLQVSGFRINSFCNGCGKKVWVPTVLLAVLALSAVALAQNERVTRLVRQGQDAMQAEDFDRAASALEQAWQIAPERKDVNRGLLVNHRPLAIEARAARHRHSVLAAKRGWAVRALQQTGSAIVSPARQC
jgi:hypothetical protein